MVSDYNPKKYIPYIINSDGNSIELPDIMSVKEAQEFFNVSADIGTKKKTKKKKSDAAKSGGMKVLAQDEVDALLQALGGEIKNTDEEPKKKKPPKPKKKPEPPTDLWRLFV